MPQDGAVGVDASIYGNLHPQQPMNFLGMVGEAAKAANLMLQNKQFQMEVGARQGMADIAKSAMNADGTMNWNKYVMGAFTDQRTAWKAPEIATQIAQKDLLNWQSLNAENTLKINQHDQLLQLVAPLLAKGNDATEADLQKVFASGLGAGLLNADEVVDWTKNTPPDQVNPQDGSKTNPGIFQMVKAQAQQTEQSRAIFEGIMGKLVDVQTATGHLETQQSHFNVGLGGEKQPVGRTGIQFTQDVGLEKVEGAAGGTTEQNIVGQVGGTPQTTNLQDGGSVQPYIPSNPSGVRTGLPQIAKDIHTGTGPMGTYKAALDERVRNDVPLYQGIQNVEEALKQFTPGTASQAMNDVARAIQRFLPNSDAAKSLIQTLTQARPGVDPRVAMDAIQRATKMLWLTSIQALKTNQGGVPRAYAEIQQNYINNPNVDMTPGAIHQMLEYQKHVMNQDIQQQKILSAAIAEAQGAKWPETPDEAKKLGVTWDATSLQNFPQIYQQGLIDSGQIKVNEDNTYDFGGQ